MTHQVEQAVLQSLIFHNEYIPRVGTVLQDIAFVEPKHRIIYKEIKTMFMEGKLVDMLSLCSNLENKKLLDAVGGYAYVADMFETFSHSANIDYYVEELLKQQTRAKLLKLSDRIKYITEEETELDESEMLSKIQSYILSLSTNSKEEKLQDQISQFKIIQEQHRHKPEGTLFGLPTGFKKLDDATDGLQKGHLIVLGGYTSAGKTFAALNIVANLIKQKKRVVFYSIEMTSIDIIARLAGILTSQNKKDIIKGKCNSVDKAIELLKESNFEIISNLNQLDEIQFSTIEKNSKQPIDLVVIDFLQLVKVKGSKGLYEEMTTVIHTIQTLAKKIEVPFLTLSQISNENAKIPSDDVSGFKGSGDIEAAADIAIKLRHAHDDTKDYKAKLTEINRKQGKVHKEDVPKVNWTIHKNRHGESGSILMRFNGYTGQFYQDAYENL